MRELLQLIRDLILDIVRQPVVVDLYAAQYAVIRAEAYRRSIQYSEGK